MTDLSLAEALAKRPSGLDRYEDCTLLAAVIHYALSIADPSECLRIMNRYWPRVDGNPWDASVHDLRTKRHTFDVQAEREAGLR